MDSMRLSIWDIQTKWPSPEYLQATKEVQLAIITPTTMV